MATALGITLALVLAACGGDGSTGGDSDVLGLGDRGLDRCSLITAAEAEQWLGSPLLDPAPSEGIDGQPDPVTCKYEHAEELVIVLIQVYDGSVFFAEEGSAARTGETITGLGEDAWSGDRSVKFLQNDWSVSVSQIAGPVPDEALLEMAQLMSSRLP